MFIFWKGNVRSSGSLVVDSSHGKDVINLLIQYEIFEIVFVQLIVESIQV